MPSTLEQIYTRDYSQARHDGLLAVIAIVLTIVVGLLVHRAVFALLGRLAKRRKVVFGAIVHRARRPAAFIVPLLFVLAIFPNLQLPPRWVINVEHVTGLATIAATAWGIIALVLLGGDFAKARHRDGEDNLAYRQTETRVDVLGRVVVTLVVMVAVASMLMTFPAVRAIGTTLLASAGVAGIAAGFATRPLLENLVAGVQIAVTQPIRLDDVVIVEKEFGKVEEITATYVVVALWDRRRMVLPLTYFINTPFQNWTRRTSDLIGSVMLYTDYSMPVDALRTELDRIVRATPLWDGSVQSVQVTDATQQTIEIRILVSARNAAQLFDLRCYVREQLVAFIAEQHPGSLPATRFEAPPPVSPQPLAAAPSAGPVHGGGTAGPSARGPGSAPA